MILVMEWRNIQSAVIRGVISDSHFITSTVGELRTSHFRAKSGVLYDSFTLLCKVIRLLGMLLHLLHLSITLHRTAGDTESS